MIPDDHALMLFKFGINKYMKELQNGRLFFSCAGNYVYIAKNNGNSEQGDEEEGVFARLKKHDLKIDECIKKYGKDLEIMDDGSHVKLRRRSSLLYPLFCLYAYRAKDVLENSNIKSGTHKYKHNFNSKIFEAFSQSSKSKNVLSEEFLPTICFFQPKPFVDVVRYSLIVNNITYKMKAINYDVKSNEQYYIEPDDARSELFYKNPKYEYQHEARICVSNRKFTSIFENEIINVQKFKDQDCKLIINHEIYFTHLATIFKNYNFR